MCVDCRAWNTRAPLWAVQCPQHCFTLGPLGACEHPREDSSPRNTDWQHRSPAGSACTNREQQQMWRCNLFSLLSAHISLCPQHNQGRMRDGCSITGIPGPQLCPGRALSHQCSCAPAPNTQPMACPPLPDTTAVRGQSPQCVPIPWDTLRPSL